MKLKTTHALTLCALTLLASQPVWAEIKPGPTKPLTVTGTIGPGNCSVTLGEGGNANFGKISKNIISDSETGNDLGKTVVLPLAIECDALTQVAINLVDNVHDSLVKDLVMYGPIGGKPTGVKSNDTSFSLGVSRSKDIGAYQVLLNNAYVGTDISDLAAFNIDTHAIEGKSDYKYLYNDRYKEAKKLFTWVKPQDDAPAVGKSFTGDMRIRASVAQASKLDLSSDVELAGSATLEVYFL